MSTRAFIGLVNKDGTVRSVYAHWDNYPSHTGVVLTNHYTTEDRINKLLDLGDMSMIGTEPIGCWSDTGVVDETHCSTYRERGEENVDAITHSSVDAFLDYADEDYTYLFKDGRWLVRHWDGPFKDLDDVLADVIDYMEEEE